jgi:hypothetical protein
MNINQFFRKIDRNICDYGFGILFKKTIAGILSPVFENRVYRIYGIDLDNFNVKRANKNRFTYKLLKISDTNLISQIEDLEEHLQGKVDEKIKKGSMCCVALAEDKVVAFNLVSFGEIYMPLIKHKKILKEDSAWSEQITTHKDWRKQGLGSEMRYRIFTELKNKGMKWLYGGTLKNNLGNLKLSSKVGLQFLVDIHYLKLFGIKKWRYKELANGFF